MFICFPSFLRLVFPSPVTLRLPPLDCRSAFRISHDDDLFACAQSLDYRQLYSLPLGLFPTPESGFVPIAKLVRTP